MISLLGYHMLKISNWISRIEVTNCDKSGFAFKILYR